MHRIPLIAVFTPSYNRGRLLERCYESLKAQTSDNFEWYIIDDGSSDCTEEVVQGWINQENKFRITYIYKPNGGLHTGYNKAIEIIENELCVCIDSDDWLPSDAIEKIERIWGDISAQGYVGVMGIDRYADGGIVGDIFPDDVHEMYLYEKLVRYKIAGDKKMVYRTQLLKKVAPMPTFAGEKNFNPSYMMYQMDRFGKLYVTNECFCIVEYQSDGMSAGIWRQYLNSPNSFAETRRLYLSFKDAPLRFRIRHAVHYVSSSILAKNRKFISQSPRKALTVAMIPLGFAFSLLTRYMANKRKEK